MKKILLIGDSWIDYLEISCVEIIETVCCPGASLYQLKEMLLIELWSNEYDFVIIIGSKNGGYVDGIFDDLDVETHLIRNDNVDEKFLLRNDRAHPNKKGIKYIEQKIQELIRQ